MFGVIGFLSEDIPSYAEEISKPCIPIYNQVELCVGNTSGIVLVGEINEDVEIILNVDGSNVSCSVGKDYLNIRTVCKDEFGYLYEKENFDFEVYVDGQLIKKVTQAELYSILLRAIAKPDKFVRTFAKDAEGLFAVRGLIYIAEHWNGTSIDMNQR